MPSAIDSKITIREEIIDMMNEKNKLEEQLISLKQVLDSAGVGMDEPLVDDQDFPRNDIDVYQIRLTRNRFICTRNDLKALMARIDKKLKAFFTHTNYNEAEYMANGHSSLKPDINLTYQ